MISDFEVYGVRRYGGFKPSPYTNKEKTMKITAHAEGTPREIATQLKAIAANFEGGSTEAGPKKKKPAKVEDEEEFDDEDSDAYMDSKESDEDPEVDAEETDDEDDSEPTKKDVLSALKKFAARGPKYADKAKATLSKFKVKHVDDLHKKHYPAVIAALK